MYRICSILTGIHSLRGYLTKYDASSADVCLSPFSCLALFIRGNLMLTVKPKLVEPNWLYQQSRLEEIHRLVSGFV